MGTYGQFALGTAAAIVNTGWLGYARVDYKVGEDVDGWSVNAGLRYQFTPGPRRGSIKDAPADRCGTRTIGPVAYVGGFAGTTWGDEHWVHRRWINTRDEPEFAGYLLGGQAGYNVQVGKLVYGIEGDYGWSNASGGKSCTGGATPFFFTCEAEVNSLASLTGRVGHTVGPRLVLRQGRVGGRRGHGSDVTEHQNLPVPPSNTPVNGESKWLIGWTVGGGMEFALTDRWSAKAEYMYYDLGQEIVHRHRRRSWSPNADTQRQHRPHRRELPLRDPGAARARSSSARRLIGIDHEASDTLSGAFCYCAPGAVTEIGVA